MTAPLFLLDAQQVGGDTVVLTGREGHHAADVRRLRVGELVDVTDGLGLRLRCRVRSLRRGEAMLQVVDRLREPAPRPRVSVAQALVKQDAAERALAGMTEVGVDVVIPWAAHRSVVTWDDDRVPRGLRRWQSWADEAAKQSRRAWVPQVEPPVDSAGLVTLVQASSAALLLDIGGDAALPTIDLDGVEDVLLVVGPEGGLTEAELASLSAAGARSVHLGPTVLRAATAGTVATAVVLSRTDRWTAHVVEAPTG